MSPRISGGMMRCVLDARGAVAANLWAVGTNLGSLVSHGRRHGASRGHPAFAADPSGVEIAVVWP